jgi:hypothetical protein
MTAYLIGAGWFLVLAVAAFVMKRRERRALAVTRRQTPEGAVDPACTIHGDQAGGSAG